MLLLCYYIIDLILLLVLLPLQLGKSFQGTLEAPEWYQEVRSVVPEAETPWEQFMEVIAYNILIASQGYDARLGSYLKLLSAQLMSEETLR